VTARHDGFVNFVASRSPAAGSEGAWRCVSPHAPRRRPAASLTPSTRRSHGFVDAVNLNFVAARSSITHHPTPNTQGATPNISAVHGGVLEVSSQSHLVSHES
jgi:hypothetical protein